MEVKKHYKVLQIPVGNKINHLSSEGGYVSFIYCLKLQAILQEHDQLCDEIELAALLAHSTEHQQALLSGHETRLFNGVG